MSLPILGKIHNMYSITRDMIYDYHRANYYGENLIIVGVGNVNHEELCSFVDKHFSKIPRRSPISQPESLKPTFKNEVFLMESELTEKVNVGLLYEGPEWTKPEYY